MPQRPHILILSTSYLPLTGGSELAIANITERLTGYDFDLVTGRLSAALPRQERIGRVQVFRAGGRFSRLTLLLPKGLLSLAMAVTAWRLARTHHYVLVHAYQASQAGGAGWLLKFLMPHTPLVVTLQEGKDMQHQSWLVKFFRELVLRRADRITAISTHLAQYAKRYSHRVIAVIPNGVDIASFTPPHHGLREHAIISVSRLVHKNGIENLIRAMPEVLAAVADARLVLVGDGKLRPHLERITSQLGLTTAVQFVGGVPHGQLPDYLWRARVFARLSLSEGLGSAFLEAMAAGCVVVGSRVGGIADFLTDGQTGLVCDPHYTNSIAAALVRALADDSVRDRVVPAAQAMVARRFSWDGVAVAVDTVYRQEIKA